MSESTVEILMWSEVVLSVLLIIVVILQPGKDGLGVAFGSTSGGESFRTKRGLESFLSYATVGLIAAISIISIFIARSI